MAEEKIGYLPPDKLQRMYKTFQLLESSGLLRNLSKLARRQDPSESPIWFRNDSGEAIPPFACMQITGTVDIGELTFVTVAKPSAIDKNYLFNHDRTIEIGGTGYAHPWGVVRMLSNGTAVVHGEYEPTVSAWTIKEGAGGPFIVYGADNTDTNIVKGRFAGGGGDDDLWVQGTLTGIADGTGAYTGKKVGTVTVVVASCNHSDLIGDSISVVDHSGCIFDLPYADMTNVWIWASWGIAVSTASGADPGTLSDCHWVADDRCCVAADTEAA